MSLKSEFSLSSPVAVSSLKNLLFNNSWRENNWMHTFPKGISTHEMQTVSSRIWTRLAVWISYDDNQYTTSATHTRMHTDAQTHILVWFLFLLFDGILILVGYLIPNS